MATQIESRIENSLNECRILILGTQVIVGFQLQAAFKERFDALSESARHLKVLSLGLSVLSLVLLLWPVARRQIVASRDDPERFLVFVSVILAVALTPCASALGIDAYVTTQIIIGHTRGVIAGIATTVVALFFWHGLEVAKRFSICGAHLMKTSTHEDADLKADSKSEEKEKPSPQEKLDEDAKLLLSEVRMILPGAQALLGFQFTCVLTDGFMKLTRDTQILHLMALGAVALCTILLIAPAAYHRLAERGANTPHFLRVGSRFLMGAMFFLAAGVSGDFYVVAIRAISQPTVALWCAALTFVACIGLWFGTTWIKRASEQRESTAVTKRIQGHAVEIR